MAAIFKRPSRLLSIVGGLLVFYVLVIFIPSQRETETVVGFEYVKSSFDWSTLPQTHPVSTLTPLPRGPPRKLPRVQHDFASDGPPSPERLELLSTRRLEVKKAFVKSWNSYKSHGWMFDEVTPVSGVGKDTFGGWAATLVDSLDSLWILDLKDEFYLAAAAAGSLDWSNTKDTSLNFFETTIRHLGGLLSAYDLSQEVTLLLKAVELGDMLYCAFDTPNRMPPFWLDFQKVRDGTLVAGYHDPSASVASAGLEFTRLAQITGNDKYYDAIDRVSRFLADTQNTTHLPGMWGTFSELL